MAEDKPNDSRESAQAVATSADLISDGVECRHLEATRRWLSGTLTALMLTCFAISGWLWLRPLMRTQEAQAVSVDAVRLPRENAPTRVTRELVNIEDVQLGRRVVGRNPLREQTQLPSDIHPETHRTIRLEMIQYGTLYELAFVRSLTWLSEQQAQVGGMIQLVMTEMGLDGPARVISIEPCPEIEPDDGTGRMVVTGTMKHLAGNVLEIQTADDTERPGVTDTHPIWSVDRQDFVVAGQLTVGESLEQADGTVTQITRITPTRGPPVMVYNLEIDAEHVFHVGEDGVLVHNACALNDEAKDALRASAREIWEARTGRRAVWDGKDVHHRIPLEWSHLFPKANPNRVANLVGMEKAAHNLVTNAWNAWRRNLNGRIPSSAVVMHQAMRLDEQFAHLMQFLP